MYISFNIQYRSANYYNSDAGFGIKLFRDATEILNDAGSYSIYLQATNHASNTYHNVGAKASWSFLDTGVSTTSQVTYKVQVGGTNSSQVRFQQGSGSLNPSDLTAMEILA